MFGCRTFKLLEKGEEEKNEEEKSRIE